MPAEPYMVKTFSPSPVLLCCRRPSDSNSSAQRWAEEFRSLLKVIGGALCFSLYLLWVSRNSCLNFASSYNRKWKYFNAKKQEILRIDSSFLFCHWKVFPEHAHLLTSHCSSMLKSNKKSQQFTDGLLNSPWNTLVEALFLPGLRCFPKAWRCQMTIQLLLLSLWVLCVHIYMHEPPLVYRFIRVSLCYVRLVKLSKRADIKYVNREQTGQAELVERVSVDCLPTCRFFPLAEVLMLPLPH